MIKDIFKQRYVLSDLFNLILNYCIIKVKNVHIGSFPRINGMIFIKNDGYMALGKDIYINSNLISNPIGGSTRTCLVTYSRNAQLIIGDRVFFSNAAIVAQNKITIEHDVYIGGSVKIYDSDFHSLNYQYRILGGIQDPDVKSKPILIKKHAFIGAHSIILKGVTIGEGAVIGAGSVVTKNVDDFEIWAGNPARFIRRLRKSEDVNVLLGDG